MNSTRSNDSVQDADTTPFPNVPLSESAFTFIDLFAGIGGIRQAFMRCGGHCVFSSEWDKFAQQTYYANYGEMPHGDIRAIAASDIPDHDILVGGFPCQPFSQAGKHLGFADTRGTLFFEIARILKEKKPKAFMLENVKQLRGHDKGRTIAVILATLDELGYYVPVPQVLDAVHFARPQHRERIIIVGFRQDLLPDGYEPFVYPQGQDYPNMRISDILEDAVDEKYTISDKAYQGHIAYREKHRTKGNGFGFTVFSPDDHHTNTISARYYKDGSEALISQEGKNPRLLTPRECARLQGFPEEFIIPVSNTQAYKQFGNSVCIPVIEAVARDMVIYMGRHRLLQDVEHL